MNMAASVHQRLLNLARQRGCSFEGLLRDYMMERFLYRLSKSGYRERFILKGALVFRVWLADSPRATMDVDLEGLVANDPSAVARVVSEICGGEVEADGLEFTVPVDAVEVIIEDAVYQGVRVKIVARLGRACIPVRVDIGFGDSVVPGPVPGSYPALLDMPQARLLTYPKETVVAEKLHAIVRLGVDNSRLKDYYDLWLMSRTFPFDGATLTEAFVQTCACRSTVIPASAAGLSQPFAERGSDRWQALVNRHRLLAPPLDEVLNELAVFLQPVLTAAAASQKHCGEWPPAGPWFDISR